MTPRMLLRTPGSYLMINKFNFFSQEIQFFTLFSMLQFSLWFFNILGIGFKLKWSLSSKKKTLAQSHFTLDKLKFGCKYNLCVTISKNIYDIILH